MLISLIQGAGRSLASKNMSHLQSAFDAIARKYQLLAPTRFPYHRTLCTKFVSYSWLPTLTHFHCLYFLSRPTWRTRLVRTSWDLRGTELEWEWVWHCLLDQSTTDRAVTCGTWWPFTGVLQKTVLFLWLLTQLLAMRFEKWPWVVQCVDAKWTQWMHFCSCCLTISWAASIASQIKR